MRQLTLREIIVLIAGAVVSAFLLVNAFVWKPALASVTRWDTAIASKQRQLADAEVTGRRLPAAEKERDALRVRVRDAERRLPKQVSVPDVLVGVSDAVRMSGVQLRDTTLSTPGPSSIQVPGAAGGSLQELTFTVNIRGTFGQLVRFLQAVEGLPRPFAVQTISVHHVGGPATSVLEVALNMKAFAMP